MNRLKVLLTCAAVVVAGAVSAQTLNEVNEKFNEGIAAYNAKNFDASIVAFQQAYDMSQTAEEDASDTGRKAYTVLGTAYYAKANSQASSRQFDDAIVSYDAAEAIFNETGDALKASQVANLRSKVFEVKAAGLAEAGDINGAIAASEAGLERTPNATDLALFNAKLLFGQGRTDEALARYAQLYDLSVSSSRFTKVAEQVDNALLANSAEAAKERPKDAQKALDLLIEYNPENSLAHLQRVQIYNASKDYASVVKYGDEAAAFQTDNNNKMTVYYLMGAAYQQRGDNANAIKYYKMVTSGQYASSAKEITESLAKKPQS